MIIRIELSRNRVVIVLYSSHHHPITHDVVPFTVTLSNLKLIHKNNLLISSATSVPCHCTLWCDLDK